MKSTVKKPLVLTLNCKLAPMLVAIGLATIALAGCGSGSSNPSANAIPSVSNVDPTTASRERWLQIMPAQQPAFDPSIHNYVVDCSAGSIDVAATDVDAVGFVFLGTTLQPTFLRPSGPAQFRQSATLAPGQAVRFALSGLGTYSVRCLPPDFPPLTVSLNGSPQAQWYVFAPDLTGTEAGDYVIITDAHGTPVWWMQEPGAAPLDARVLDSNHISWAQFHFAGRYFIHDFTGAIVNKLNGGLDIHDLQPTGRGTYLSIRYQSRDCPPDCADMSAWGGSSQMSVTDGEIVELDANSNVLWSWSTRDHIALSEAGSTGWFPGVGADIIHMNAVEPDGDDAVIFSGRHLNAIYRVIKSTGEIDWKIGGTPRPESLTVTGDLRPTANGPNGQVLRGQHDVRRLPDGTISVHDNGTGAGRQPSIMRYRLNLASRTAEVVQEIHDDRITDSGCCGSARLLPGGNWVVQWGGAPFLTELDPVGNPVLTISYNSGPTFSYRAVPVLPGIVAERTLWSGMDALYFNRR